LSIMLGILPGTGKSGLMIGRNNQELNIPLTQYYKY